MCPQPQPPRPTVPHTPQRGPRAHGPTARFMPGPHAPGRGCGLSCSRPELEPALPSAGPQRSPSLWLPTGQAARQGGGLSTAPHAAAPTGLRPAAHLDTAARGPGQARLESPSCHDPLSCSASTLKDSAGPQQTASCPGARVPGSHATVPQRFLQAGWSPVSEGEKVRKGLQRPEVARMKDASGKRSRDRAHRKQGSSLGRRLARLCQSEH